MKKIKRTHVFRCGKCNEGEIVVTHKFDGEINELNIKKCSYINCKYQYYFKELSDAKLEKISKEVE